MIKQDNCFVSFCFSTYKRPGHLRTTLQKILLQTFRDYEVIVSDNDPEESGRATVEAFNDPRFHYFPNGENLGMKKSYNKSLERSKGQYIVMIADDDPVYPDMLETLVALQEEYPGYGMYMGGCDWFCTDAELGRLYNFKVGTNSCLSGKYDVDHKEVFGPGDFLNKLFTFNIFPHYLWSTMIVKREILVRIGGVPEYGTPFLGDYAYMSALGAQSGCVIINRSLGCQTLHKENFGRSQNEQIAPAAQNFPLYVESKASHLPEWPVIKEHMLRFTGLWVVSHMAFLSSYYKKTNTPASGFRNAEKAVFQIEYMKKYKLKYYLKKNFPAIHTLLVNMKRSVK